MLLRRVRQHVVNENWFAVFVDFVIVVVGVYVGIEVSNWNEARREDVQATEYLERIRADLVHDRTAAANRRDFWRKVTEYGQAAIAHAEHGELFRGSVGQTLLAYYQASQVDPYASVSTTYEEMKAAGDLRLIRNAELRTRLANYYVYATSLQAEHLFQFVPKYREHVRGALPSEIQRFVFDQCHVTEQGIQRFLDCDLPVDSEAGRALLASLRGDAQIVSSLRFWITNLGVASKVIDDNMMLAGELLELVDAALAAD